MKLGDVNVHFTSRLFVSLEEFIRYAPFDFDINCTLVLQILKSQNNIRFFLRTSYPLPLKTFNGLHKPCCTKRDETLHLNKNSVGKTDALEQKL